MFIFFIINIKTFHGTCKKKGMEDNFGEIFYSNAQKLW